MLRVALYTLLLGCSLATTNGVDVCEFEEDGARLAHPTDCSKFLECEDGKTVAIRACPYGLHFNRYESICDYKFRAGCDVSYALQLLNYDSDGEFDCEVCEAKCGRQKDNEELDLVRPLFSMLKDKPQRPEPPELSPPPPPPSKPAGKPCGAPTAPTTAPPTESPQPPHSEPTPPPPPPPPPSKPSDKPCGAPTAPTPAPPTESPQPPHSEPTPPPPQPAEKPCGPPTAPTPPPPPPPSKPAEKPCGTPTAPTPTPSKPTTTPCNTTPSTPSTAPCAEKTTAKPTASPCGSKVSNNSKPDNGRTLSGRLAAQTFSGQTSSKKLCEDPGQCAGQRDGAMFSDPLTTGFIVCRSECEIKMTCPKSLVYNPKLRVCDWPQD